MFRVDEIHRSLGIWSVKLGDNETHNASQQGVAEAGAHNSTIELFYQSKKYLECVDPLD